MNGTFRFGTFRVEGLELLDNSNVLVTLVNVDPVFSGRMEVEMAQTYAAGFPVGAMLDIETQTGPSGFRPMKEAARGWPADAAGSTWCEQVIGWERPNGCMRGCRSPHDCMGDC